MELPDKLHEVYDPQNRRILFFDSDIIEKAMAFGFADTVPQHFVTIFTKPDTIYVDTRNNVHCYTKHLRGKIYSISTLETEEAGEKFFVINSWFEEKDTTLETIEQFAEAAENEELRKQMDVSINENSTWMKILYNDSSFMTTKKYTTKGIHVIEKDGQKTVEIPARKKIKEKQRKSAAASKK